jgi:hypothetical protein
MIEVADLVDGVKRTEEAMEDATRIFSGIAIGLIPELMKNIIDEVVSKPGIRDFELWSIMMKRASRFEFDQAMEGVILSKMIRSKVTAGGNSLYPGSE